ncbi:MAG: C25 family cysteine peptidase [Bacteroidota bacterium]
MKRILLALLFLGVSVSLFAQSPLADGQLLKLRISKGGVYKITCNQLQDAGIAVESLNPAQIQLFGFGGGVLSQANADYDLNEPLPERAIRVVGDEDGSFDPSDYILFYADEPYNLTFDTENELIHHEAALYDDFNYYFLKVGTQTGKRITDASLSATSGQVINTYNAMRFHETDEYNILASIRRAPGGSGREWFGEIFDFTPSQDFTFDLSGQTSDSPVSITTRAYGYGFSQTHYEVSVGDVEVDRLDIIPSVDATYTQKGRATESTGIYAGEVSDEFIVNLTYQKGNTSALGFLDFMEVNFTRNLELYEPQTPFYTFGLSSNELYTFAFSNSERKNVEIWEIGDPQNAKLIIEGNETRLDFSMPAPEVPRFIAFDQDGVPEVEIVGEVTNQNLLGVAAPNLLIVTPTIFKAEAERLAEFRRTADGLSVEVVELSQIYNTFSSGRQDITAIRNFTRSLYLKSPEEFRYVLLFGDASYDPKNRTDNNTNFIPIYQSRDSFDPIYSFSSDDYFAFVDETEGKL